MILNLKLHGPLKDFYSTNKQAELDFKYPSLFKIWRLFPALGSRLAAFAVVVNVALVDVVAGKADQGSAFVGHTNNGTSLPRNGKLEKASKDDDADVGDATKGTNVDDKSVSDAVEDKNLKDAKDNSVAIETKPPKVRGPAWLAFTGKSNGKPDSKPVKPVSVDSKPVKPETKPVLEKVNGQNAAEAKPVPTGSKPVIADSKPVLKDVKPVLVETKTEGTPKPEPAPLASDEITSKDLDLENKSERPKTPVLRKVGEKTPPGTLKRDRPTSSCKSWCSQYSQSFLAKTIDTPLPNVEPLNDDNDEQVSVL